ncbi:MAG TPA: CheR family methyltransferase [Burkholderiaceae bacterium]
MGARDDSRDTTTPLAVDNDARLFDLSARDFDRVRRIIYGLAGIDLNPSKQNMVYSRLSRRLRALGIDSFERYLDRLEGDPQFTRAERQEFVNSLTTNLTSFFREQHHFPVFADFLARGLGASPPRIWCAAASTGEEPYSIAMTVVEALGERAAARVLATDIDTQVLACASRGVYRDQAAQVCGPQRMRRFFLRGTGSNAGMVRVRPEVARMIEFGQLNLLEADWPLLKRFGQPLDAVFCRNVMIYFNRATQREVLQRIAGVLRPGGLLFAGHSENFTDCREWFALRGKTVYERL